MTDLIGDTLLAIQVVLLLSNLVLAIVVFVNFVRPDYFFRVARRFRNDNSLSFESAGSHWGVEILHRLRWFGLLILFFWSAFCGAVLNLINHIP